MAEFHWGNAFDAFRDLEREVDRLLQSVGQTFEGLRFGRPYPPVNIYDLDGEFLLIAELPGMTVEELELSVADGVLTMKGHRGMDGSVPEERYRRSERVRAEWKRTIPIPERVLEDKLSAELKHGVLRLHLPKAPSSQPRSIPVLEK